ncbi:S-adenosylmethionine-dependent nucleotide dehydratase RSAD2-like [Oculina patagonica]
MLKEAGMEKINFSGGEPFIHKRGEFVGELTRNLEPRVTPGSSVRQRLVSGRVTGTHSGKLN